MRPVLWYLALVGLPFIALLAILRVGEQLQPPRAVHGRYVVSFDSLGRGPCLSALVDTAEHNLTISQSGPRLEIAIGALTLEGRIVGDSVRAATAIVDKSALRGTNCLTIDTVRIVTQIERTSNDLRLPGQFQFSGCASCPPLMFRATHVAHRSGDSGH